MVTKDMPKSILLDIRFLDAAEHSSIEAFLLKLDPHCEHEERVKAVTFSLTPPKLRPDFCLATAARRPAWLLPLRERARQRRSAGGRAAAQM
jgi:hypothetical protein